jgi:hypothetical protein
MRSGFCLEYLVDNIVQRALLLFFYFRYGFTQ